MKFLVSLFISALFVGVLSTEGVAGGDKSAGGQDKSSHDASASPSTSGQDKGQDASASPSSSGQDKPASLPAPVSKDECMNDGWRKFGFSSEADCLSSIKP